MLVADNHGFLKFEEMGLIVKQRGNKESDTNGGWGGGEEADGGYAKTKSMTRDLGYPNLSDKRDKLKKAMSRTKMRRKRAARGKRNG